MIINLLEPTGQTHARKGVFLCPGRSSKWRTKVTHTNEIQLSPSEAGQISLDYFADSRAVLELQRFYGIHVKEVEQIECEILAHREIERAQLAQTAQYTRLRDWIREENPCNTENKMLSAITHAAGEVAWSDRLRERHSLSAVVSLGSELSAEAAAYFKNRLPYRAYISICGTRYEYAHPVITRQLGAKVMTFATGDVFNEIARDVLVTEKRNGAEVRTQYARHPTLDDWTKWIQGMGKVALY